MTLWCLTSAVDKINDAPTRNFNYNVVSNVNDVYKVSKLVLDKPNNTKVTDYGDQLVSVPRAHLRMELLQTTDGLFLTHEGKSVLECYLTEDGMLIAGFIAKALGVNIPAMNQPIPIRVSTGVLYRALGISYLDLHNQESYTILERLLEEAAMQRRGTNESL